MTIKEKLIKAGIVSLSQAEKVTGIKADTLKKRIQAGKLDAIKVGKTWLIFLPDLKK